MKKMVKNGKYEKNILFFTLRHNLVPFPHLPGVLHQFCTESNIYFSIKFCNFSNTILSFTLLPISNQSSFPKHFRVNIFSILYLFNRSIFFYIHCWCFWGVYLRIRMRRSLSKWTLELEETLSCEACFYSVHGGAEISPEMCKKRKIGNY